MEKELKLNEDIRKINLKAEACDVVVSPGDIKRPIIKCPNGFSLKENDFEVALMEENLKSEIVLDENGKLITANIVHILIPKNQYLSFYFNIRLGNISMDNLMINRLKIMLSEGNIDLNDIDLLYGNLVNHNGDMDIKLLESLINYETFLKAKTIKNQDNEIKRPNVLLKRHYLKCNAENGKINLLFKGKTN